MQRPSEMGHLELPKAAKELGNGRKRHFGITFVSSALIRKCDWEISDSFTLSEHQEIHDTMEERMD